MAKSDRPKMALLDRAALAISPRWGVNRLRNRAIAQALARHYEAAQGGRRTSNWARNNGDANAVIGPALAILRSHARSLVRNNGWAKNGERIIGRNTVGWGLMPRPINFSGARTDKRVRDIWPLWADTTQCDFDGRNTFYGLQRIIMETIAVAGEVLVRRRRRPSEDGLDIPLQLQVLEPDFLDTSRDGQLADNGNTVIQGVEYNAIGKRTAYYLFDQHPGSNAVNVRMAFKSHRVPAEEVLHIFRTERAGQVRGVSWYAPAVVKLKDFDEYEDATLMRQKIAACFAAFVTDMDGTSAAVGETSADEPLIETLEPGLISYLPPGKEVAFGNPPLVNDHESFSKTNLRGIAAGLGVTYEDLTQDYSNVNFSSARMSRIAHWGNVHDWRWNMLVPQFCNPAYAWAMEALLISGKIAETPRAEWTPPPMPMIEPDKEGLAYGRLVRVGAMTHNEMVREQGRDPATHWAEYAEGQKTLDALKIKLDSDVRAVSQAGLTQERAAGAGGKPGADKAEEDDAKE